MAITDVLRVTAEPLEDAIIIRATGDIDMGTVDLLRDELDSAREQGASVLLDLFAVRFIDSTGLQLLLQASEMSAHSDWGFFLVRPSEAVQRLMQISGTADLITVVDTGAERILR
jgi:anti-anti-sigma factor